MDFGKEPIGQFPASLRLLRGSMAVVENGGKRMLSATDNAEFLISLPERLPAHFTLEFDLISKEDYTTDEIDFEGTPAYTVGPASALVKWGRTGITIVGGSDAGNVYLTTPADIAAELAGQPGEFRADIDGNTMTFHANGRQIARVTDTKFVRGRVLRVFLGGEGARTGATVYLSRLRIADAGTSAPVVAQETRTGPVSGGTIAGAPSPTASRTPVPGVGGKLDVPIDPRPDRSQGPPAAGDGPPPTELRVTGYSPILQVVEWSVPSTKAFTAAEVWRKTSTALAWEPVPTIRTAAADDSTVLPTGGATYRVVVHYADGKTGVADVAFTTPALPRGIIEISGRQTDVEGEVALSWKSVRDVQGYRIFGPGQPADGKVVQGAGTTLDTVTGVPPGDATFRMVPFYALPVPNVPEKTYTMRVIPRVARYRITVLGFRANQATVDDALQLDGKGDEVYVAASVVRLEMTPTLQGFTYKGPVATLKSSVHGDVNGFPQRVRAGSMSAQGGIKAGDAYPADPSAPTSSPQASALPMVLVDATMTYRKDVYVIAPSLWEWDGDASVYTGWAGNLASKASSPVGLSATYLRNQLAKPTLGTDWFFVGTDQNPGYLAMKTPAGKDRPVGLSPDAYRNLALPDVGYAISQERLERAFEAAGTTRLIASLRWVDFRPGNDCTSNALCGDYTVWFQFERLP